MIGSPEFLAVMSEMTGIPDLLLDPKMYGGGTHENLHGQSLDAHVDFNYDEAQKLHRRLNLIVYLKKTGCRNGAARSKFIRIRSGRKRTR